MDAVMMAHQIIEMHENLNCYRDSYCQLFKENEELRRKYDELMSGQLLELLLAHSSLPNVHLVFKDDKMLEYSAPEILFVYADKGDAEKAVDTLNEEGAKRGHFEEYYSLSWELRLPSKKEETT